MTNVLSTPLGLNAVYTIASAFPVMANPSLTLVSGLPTAVGSVIELKPEMVPVGDRCATFVCGLDIIVVQTQGTKNDMVVVEVPMNISGQHMSS